MVEFDDPATLTDKELLAAYETSSGEEGDPIAAALLAEIERRDLDL